MTLPEVDLNPGTNDPLDSDPEVRQARCTAQAARARLAACVALPRVDLGEAQRMLDVLRRAEELLADAEDRVLVHHGLLTPADADQRAAARRPTPAAPDAAPSGTTAVRAEDSGPSTDGAPSCRSIPSSDGIPSVTSVPSTDGAPWCTGVPSTDGALVIPFRTVQVPVPALPAGTRRTAMRAASALLPPVVAGLAGAALACRFRRPPR